MEHAGADVHEVPEDIKSAAKLRAPKNIWEKFIMRQAEISIRVSPKTGKCIDQVEAFIRNIKITSKKY